MAHLRQTDCTGNAYASSSKSSRLCLSLQFFYATLIVHHADHAGANAVSDTASNIIITAQSAESIRADTVFTSTSLPTALAVQLCAHGRSSAGLPFLSYTTAAPACVKLMKFSLISVDDVTTVNHTALTVGEVSIRGIMSFHSPTFNATLVTLDAHSVVVPASEISRVLEIQKVFALKDVKAVVSDAALLSGPLLTTIYRAQTKTTSTTPTTTDFKAASTSNLFEEVPVATAVLVAFAAALFFIGLILIFVQERHAHAIRAEEYLAQLFAAQNKDSSAQDPRIAANHILGQLVRTHSADAVNDVQQQVEGTGVDLGDGGSPMQANAPSPRESEAWESVWQRNGNAGS